MATKKKTTNNTTSVDATSAQRAFEQVQGLLGDLPKERVKVPRVNVDRCIEGVLRVVERMRKLGVPERIARLPKEEIKPGQFDRIEELAWATWHCEHKLQIQRASEDQRAVPAALSEEAKAVEERMQGCAEYMLEDVEAARPVLLHLSEGTGIRDLAHDLRGYADLYELYPEMVKRDGRAYDPEDPARARGLAAQILETLAKEEQSPWNDLRDRSWTLLVEVYEEVSELARWLVRKDAEAVKSIATIHQLGRSAAKRKAAVSEDEVEDEAEVDEGSPGGF